MSKAGTRTHNTHPIPDTAKIYTTNTGREYYVSGISNTNIRIRYIDDGTFQSIPWQGYGFDCVEWSGGVLKMPCCVEEPLRDLSKIKPKTQKQIREENQLKTRI